MAEVAPGGADARSRGLLLAFAAYGAWGLFPLFWKQLAHVPALEQLTHRIVWALLVFVLISVARKELPRLRSTWSNRASRRWLLLSALLIGVNWFTFVYAVDTGRVLHASLGYFINPIVNIVLGMVFLRERLQATQMVAVALAVVGISILTIEAGGMPWIALVLAGAFGTYGLVRKVAPADALAGATIEVCILAPACLAWILHAEWTGAGSFLAVDARTTGLLVATGAVTAIPLLWFVGAARRLPLSTMGFIQYLAPSLQFLLAVLVYDEAFGGAQIRAFSCIWAALGLVVMESLLRRRKA